MNRELEQLELAGTSVQSNMDEIDVKIARTAPEIWLTAGIVREYYDAIKSTFKDDEDNPMLSSDQIIKLVIGTLDNIRR